MKTFRFKYVLVILLCGVAVFASAQTKSKYPIRPAFILNAGISDYRQPAFGFTFAGIGQYGFYVSGLIGLDNIHPRYDFKAAPDGSLTSGEYAGLIPFYTGRRAVNRFSATAGMLFQMVIPLYLTVGGGYGYRTETQELLNKQWVEAASSLGHSGVAEFGLIGRIDNLTLMAGYTLFIGRQAHLYHEAKVGIGYTFDKR